MNGNDPFCRNGCTSLLDKIKKVIEAKKKSSKVHVALAAERRLGILIFLVLGATYRAHTSLWSPPPRGI